MPTTSSLRLYCASIFTYIHSACKTYHMLFFFVRARAVNFIKWVQSHTGLITFNSYVVKKNEHTQRMISISKKFLSCLFPADCVIHHHISCLWLFFFKIFNWFFNIISNGKFKWIPIHYCKFYRKNLLHVGFFEHKLFH